MDFNTNTKNKAPFRQSQNVIEVFREEDFGIAVAGVITLLQGITYLLKNAISTDKQFDISGIPAFSPATIISSQKESNSLTSTATGTGGAAFFITSDPGAVSALSLSDLTINNTGDRCFAILEAPVQTSALLLIQNTVVLNFSPGTTFNNMIVSLSLSAQWRNSGRINLIDISFRWTDSFLVNSVDSNDIIFDVMTSDNSVSSRLSFVNAALSGSTNEITFFLHSNLSPTSLFTFIVTRFNVFSDAGGAFFGTKTGTVSSVADGGGGKIVCTAEDHNFENGDTVTHDTDFSDVNYQGVFTASEVFLGTSYEVVAPFTATDTGTWTNKGIDGSDPRVTSSNNAQVGLKDSMSLSSVRSTKTFVVNGTGVQNTFVPIVDSVAPASGDFIIDTEERFTTDDQTGLATYIGLTNIDVEVKYSFGFMASGPTQNLEFAITQNGTVVSSSILPFDTSVTGTLSTIGTVLLLAPGDTVGLVKNNTSNTNDTDISSIRRLILPAG